MAGAAGRPRGAQTRQRILETAAGLFVSKGYAATSIRDISGALGISNPALYHHFPSKADILLDLLAEPMAMVAKAVDEAERLSGDDRARRLVIGLLEALEVHSGIAVAGLNELATAGPGDGMAGQLRPMVRDLLAEVAAEDDRDLRVRMAMAAVEGAVASLNAEVADAEEFVTRLRAEREAIASLALRLLR